MHTTAAFLSSIRELTTTLS
jgi:hypothetical protein